MTVQDIFDLLNTRAPFDTAAEWDNPGLLVGDGTRRVNRVLVALDATPGAIDAAQAVAADLMVTHHPVIFTPLKALPTDSLPYRLAAAGIPLIAAHTNLDKAADGVNDTLAALLGLADITVAADGMSRIGTLPAPMTAIALASLVAERLHTAVRVADSHTPIRRVAVCGGGGGDFAAALVDVADAFVTGEIKHHEWLAADGTLALIEAGHYATEAPVIDTLCRWLTQAGVEAVPYYEGDPYITITN